MALLLITHDLGIVAKMAHRVAVMYAGEIVELAEREAFFRAPQHPYSQKLFAALPAPQRRAGELAVIRGQVPPLTQPFTSLPLRRSLRLRLRPLPGRGAEAARAGHGAARPLPSAGAGRGAARAASRFKEQARAEATAGQQLLEVKDLKVHFPIRKRHLQAHRGLREGGRRRVVRAARRAHARAGRRVGLRQDHDRQGAAAAHRADRRQRALRRTRHYPESPRARCGRCAARCRSSSRIRMRRSIRACGCGDPARGDAQPEGRGGRRRKEFDRWTRSCRTSGLPADVARTATRTSSPAASASASPSRARWR